MVSERFCPKTLDEFIGHITGVWCGVFHHLYFLRKKKTNVSNANSLDPDKTQRFLASDLGLHR